MNDTLNERFGRDQPIVHIGVLVAAADRTDPRYGACSRLLTNEPQPLVTTAMLRRRMCSTGNSGRASRHRLLPVLDSDLASGTLRHRACQSGSKSSDIGDRVRLISWLPPVRMRKMSTNRNSAASGTGAPSRSLTNAMARPSGEKQGE
jgi:hypothetical protein